MTTSNQKNYFVKNTHRSIDVSGSVLDKIKKQKIKMTERWVFWAKKLGLGSGLTLTIIILIIIINLILYFFQSRGLILYLNFGLPAVALILKNLPFAYFAIAIILLVIINLIIKKTNIIYKKYYRLILIIIWGIIIGSGLFLFFTGLNDYFEKQAALSQKKIFLLSEIYKGEVPCLPADKAAVVGKVIEKGQSSIIIQTMDNQKKVTITGPKEIFIDIPLGRVVAAVGTGGETLFVANKIKVVTLEMMEGCLNQL